MNIKLLTRLPRKINVAVSGGPDSMAVLDFLSLKHDVRVIHIDHETKFSVEARELVEKYCLDKNLNVEVHTVSELSKETVPPSDRGNEYNWSHYRHFCFNNQTEPVILSHHLDDAVERYVYNSLRINTDFENWVYKIKTANVLRPFLTTRKSSFIEWCDRRNIPYLNDPTNLDGTSNMRSYIRSKIDVFEHVSRGGIYKKIRKKIEAQV